MKNCYDFLFFKSVYVDKTLYLQGFGENGGGGGIRTPVTSIPYTYRYLLANNTLPTSLTSVNVIHYVIHRLEK